MQRALIRWIITTLAILAIPHLVSGVHVASFGAALAFALVLGVLNTLVRPVLVVLTFPLTFISLGLFLLVINALIFQWAGAIVEGIVVDGFGAAFISALAVSAISWLMDFATGKKKIQRVILRNGRPPEQPNVPGGTIDLKPDGDHWE